MTTLREAAQMALDWADKNGEAVFAVGGWEAVSALNKWLLPLRAALAQPEQHPQEDDLSEITNLLPNCSVVKLDNKTFLVQPKTKESKQQWETRRKQIDGYFAVLQEVLTQPDQPPTNNGRYLTGYTAPPQREWQGLTRKQLLQIWGKPENFNDPMRFARAIEAKLREKNT